MGRKSKKAHKFEDNYGTKLNKTCPDCKLPQAECTCESKNEEKKMEQKLREAVRKLVFEVMAEASRGEIEKLLGKEAAIKYRKATGEVKTYFGRFTKISGENVYAGVLGKGLRAFKIANILSVSPASFTPEQKTSLDEMCHEEGSYDPKCASCGQSLGSNQSCELCKQYKPKVKESKK